MMKMKRAYVVFAAVVVIASILSAAVLAGERDGCVYFEAVTPESATAGQPFTAKVFAKDASGRVISDYSETGNDVEVTTTGTGVIKPSLIPASRFKNGVADVEFIYDKAEDFNILFSERPSLERENGEEGVVNATRIIIAASGPIKYRDIQKDNPPRLEIRFSSRNVFSEIEERTFINRGLIDEVKTAYYYRRTKEGALPVKSLTFYLAEKTHYKILEEEEMIAIEFETPPGLLEQDLSFGETESIEITTPQALALDEKENTLIRSLIEAEIKLKGRERGTGLASSDPLERKTEETLDDMKEFLTGQEEKRPEELPRLAAMTDASLFSSRESDTERPLFRRGAMDKKFNIVLAFFITAIILFIVFVIWLNILWYKEKKILSDKRSLLDKDEKLVEERPISPIESQVSVSEAYRSLRTNILSLDTKPPLKTLLVTSALPQEGKTSVVTNLAATLAYMGSRVLLVDSALRRPSMDKIFRVGNSPGLTEILTEGVDWKKAVKETNIENLSVITSGKKASRPSEMLGSAKMEEVLTHLKEKFDMVLFDSSDIIGVTDSAVLGAKLDGALLVVRTRKTQRETVMHAQSLLEAARTKVLGYTLTYVNTFIPKWFTKYLYLLEPKL